MIVVLDTNVVLQASKAGHPLHVIFGAWLRRKFLWAVSNDILTEYQEIILQRSGPARWAQLARVFDLADRRGDLLLHVSPSYHYRVVTADPDDNKFCDCAITANADYVVKNDGDFAPLANAGYKPRPITPEEFIQEHLARI